MPAPAVLIPAYCPQANLIGLASDLARLGFAPIVIVDDGSGPACRPVFDALAAIPGTHILRHAINLGKGAALKTGMNWLLAEYPDLPGVVTADGDGQHHPDDILAVSRRFLANPENLVLGARQFAGDVPLRSRFGNLLTRNILQLVLGNHLTDTQTGLRAIPRALMLRLLPVVASGYEFELEMLVAAKHQGIPVVEEPIRTIYEPGNPTSHFQPLRDSMRIYFVLLRFAFISGGTALLDNFVFSLVFHATGNIAQAQILGRFVAVLFNYGLVRKAVFFSDQQHSVVLPRYLLLVAVNACISYAGLRFISTQWPVGVVPAKLLAETLLFIANFAIKRDFVFTRKKAAGGSNATDWDTYYKSVPSVAHITRKYTESVLIKALVAFAPPARRFVEIGGANSCFLDAILARLQPAVYHVVDLNRYGLDLLAARTRDLSGKHCPEIVLHHADALRIQDLNLVADAVFSIGMVDHFDPAGTRAAIQAHFAPLQPGGIAIISFPTPTWLYRLARGLFESLGLWKFPDERPLKREEVAANIEGLGEIIFEKTLWPLIFTQHVIVARRIGIPVPSAKP